MNEERFTKRRTRTPPLQAAAIIETAVDPAVVRRKTAERK